MFRIGLLVLLAGLSLVILGRALSSRRQNRDTREPVSLAVLPFSGGETDAGASHLAVGMGVDLLERLQGVSALQCIPREAVLAHRAADETARQMAKRLGAEILIRGSLTGPGGKLQVTLEILDATNGQPVATPSFESARDQILDLQKRLAHQVATSLQLPLTRADRRRLRRNPSRSLKAWTAFAQGVEALEDLVNPRSPDFAAELLAQATRLDPDFAQARAHLSSALWRRYMHRRDPADYREAARHADRALAQRPDLDAAVIASALVEQIGDRQRELDLGGLPTTARVSKPDQVWRALAAIWLQVGELELAESAWLGAISSAPDHWLNPYGYGRFLLRSGRLAESEQAFHIAAELAPATNLWPRENLLALHLTTGDLSAATAAFESMETPLTDFELLRQLAATYAILGRLEPAERLYRQALELEPVNPKVIHELGDVLYRGGRTTEAIALFSSALERLPAEIEGPSGATRQRLRSLFLAKTNNCQEALPLATTLLRHQTLSAEMSLDLAKVFALCGDHPLALEALAAAIGQGLSPELIRSQYEFEQLTDNADFQRLVQGDDAIPPSP